MAATPTRQPRGDGTAPLRARQAAAPPTAAAPSVPQRRRWGRMAAGFVLVLGGGLVAGRVLGAAGDRIEVVAVARDVPKHETIRSDDLVRVQVAADPDVETVSAGDLEDVIGDVAATDLVGGGLLSPDQVRSSAERTVRASETIVGLVLSPADAPLGQLSAGADVFVVVRPVGETDDVTTVQGWLLDVSAAARPNGDRPVSVVVPTTDVGEVSAAAGEDRVTVSVREE